MVNKYKILIIVTLVIGITIIPAANAEDKLDKNEINILSNNNYFNEFNDYTNITVEEVWNLLNSTSNGIQIPIDVRTDSEWTTEHIDTPYPEYALHWPNLQNGENFEEFINIFSEQEVIIYCRSGVRSYKAVQLLIDNGFSGTIYNMIGGIIEWKNQFYPVKPNESPDLPTINGPTSGKPETKYTFNIVANDPDYDTVFLCINWSDGTGEICIGPYDSSEEVSVSHTWAEKGTFSIKIKAQDLYDYESEVATYDISIPRKRLIDYSFISQLIERFPMFKQILILLN